VDLGMSAEKLNVEERLDIEELFAKYCWGLNTGDIAAVLACFAENAILEHPPHSPAVGHQEIKANVEDIWYSRPGWFVGRQHLASNFLMGRENDGIRVKAYWTIVQRNLESMEMKLMSLGHWNNFCIWQDGKWLFKEHVVAIWNSETTPWIGDDRARCAKRDQ
jgi:hypothetical protein